MQLLECKYRRLRNGWSQRAVARMAKLPAWRIVDIELGKRSPRLNEAIAIAHVLHVPVENLCDLIEVDEEQLRHQMLAMADEDPTHTTGRLHRLRAHNATRDFLSTATHVVRIEEPTNEPET